MDTSDWPGIRSCCDKHDECYDTCGSVKKTCDQHFEKCLNQACKSLRTSILDLLNQGSRDYSNEDIHDMQNKNKANNTGKGGETGKTGKGCDTLGNIMVGVVKSFGCDAFQRGQRRVCSCEL